MLCRRGLLLVSPLFLLLGQASGDERTPDVDRLIRQLGSERFREREAATRALDGLGELALGALRKAVIGSSDAEVWHRAERLVRTIEGRVLAEVKTSKLSFQDKYRRISKVIEPGMTGERVSQMLGQPTTVGRVHRQTFECFPAFGVVVTYNDLRTTKVDRVQQWGN